MPIGDLRALMRPLWRVHRSWALAVPYGFRTPVPVTGALGLAMASFALGWYRCFVAILLSFRWLLRPGETKALRWSDIVLFDAEEQLRYPNIYMALHAYQSRRHGGINLTLHSSRF